MGPLRASPNPVRQSSAETLATAIYVLIAIALLYFGSGIIVPLVLSVLLAFALGPIVRAMRRIGIPHMVAVLVSVTCAILIIVAIAYTAVSQFISLAAELPRYQATIGEKLRGAQEMFGGGGFFDRIALTVERLGAQLQAQTGAVEGPDPIQVIVLNQGAGPIETVRTVLFAILGPLTTVLIVTIFLIFLLLEREDLRDRFLKLVSHGDLKTSTVALNEATERVGRYLLVQFGVNVLYGALFGAGLLLLGVPNAILWGLLGVIFRYIPFVGTIIMVAVPLALSIAVDPGWTMFLGTLGIYFFLEISINNAVEPRLYGTSTGMTPLAVLVAAMFWATLWGPIGLIVATPLTVCILVLARYVRQLKFLETLLGSEPVLEPHERFYQRLVAGNGDEALAIAESVIRAEDGAGFADDVALKALLLAQDDISSGSADAQMRARILETLGEVVEEIEPDEADDATLKVMVFGGRTELDWAAGKVLGYRLAEMGCVVSDYAPAFLRRNTIGDLDLSDVDAVCLCYLGGQPAAHIGFATRRLRQRKPDLTIIVALLNPQARGERDYDQFPIDGVASTFAETVTLVTEGGEADGADARVKEATA